MVVWACSPNTQKAKTEPKKLGRKGKATAQGQEDNDCANWWILGSLEGIVRDSPPPLPSPNKEAT